jgi:hypothetical protein
MASLPCLRNLEICRVVWETEIQNDKYTFPPLDLLSLELNWDPDIRALEAVMRGVRTHKLQLTLPSLISPIFISAISEYLRFLGTGLHILEFDYDYNQIGILIRPR